MCRYSTCLHKMTYFRVRLKVTRGHNEDETRSMLDHTMKAAFRDLFRQVGFASNFCVSPAHSDSECDTDSATRATGCALEFGCYLVHKLRYTNIKDISAWMAAILDMPLLVWSYNNLTGPIAFLNHENIVLALAVVFLFSAMSWGICFYRVAILEI